MINVGIVGGAGYTGGELLRILINHPEVNIKFVHSNSNAGNPIHKVHQDLIGFTDIVFTDTLDTDIDALVMCLGHGDAKKFLDANPDFYNVFSMDSKSVICKDPKMALGAGGKTGIVRQKDPETKKTKIIFRRPKNVVMDEDFFDDRNNEKVMEKGQQAKYENEDNEMERNVLLATKDAKLLHYIVSRAKK